MRRTCEKGLPTAEVWRTSRTLLSGWMSCRVHRTCVEDRLEESMTKCAVAGQWGRKTTPRVCEDTYWAEAWTQMQIHSRSLLCWSQHDGTRKSSAVSHLWQRNRNCFGSAELLPLSTKLRNAGSTYKGRSGAELLGVLTIMPPKKPTRDYTGFVHLRSLWDYFTTIHGLFKLLSRAPKAGQDTLAFTAQ